MSLRNSSLGFVLLVGTGLVFLKACSDPEPDRPNVLLVTLDTTRADHLSAYGFRPGHTPHFDSIGEDGVRFDHALSASAVTPVSHATILTGRYPYNHGLRVLAAEGGYRLPNREKPLSTLFKQAGYRTGAVHSSFAVSSLFGLDRDFDLFESFDAKFKKNPDGTVSMDGALQRRSDETTDIALDFLDDSGEPFFLWMHYWDPHDPGLLPPTEFLEGLEMIDVLDENGIMRKTYADADLGYAAEVRFVDHQFGRLIEGLKARGLYENTIIVVTADHGEGLSDGYERHGWRAHRLVYQEQIHVPLLIRAPGVEGGRSVSQVVSTADIVPTLLELTSLEPPKYDSGMSALDGRSLMPLWRDEPARAGETVYVYADQVNGYDWNAKMVEEHPEWAWMYMITDGEWKLTYRPNLPGASELFHLPTDPGERDNVISREPKIAEKLLVELAKRRPWRVAPFEEDEDAQEVNSDALAQIGYAERDPSQIVEHVDDVAWTWTCPRHMDLRFDEGLRHDEDGCRSYLIPIARGQ